MAIGTKDTITNRKKLHKKLWSIFSIYIRKRDKKCYTCLKMIWDEQLGEWSIKGLEAGHFKHNVLDFDEMNIHAQCTHCNHYNSGKLDVYAENLIRDYGLKEFQNLCDRAKNALKGELHSVEWYLERIEFYKNLI